MAAALAAFFLTSAASTERDSTKTEPYQETEASTVAADRVQEVQTLAARSPVTLQNATMPPSLERIFDESSSVIDRMKAVEAVPHTQERDTLAAFRWLVSTVT